jgi:acyl carrier protein
MDLKENIRQYIAKNMLFSDEGFPHADDASFLEEGIIDSIGFMELVAYVQQTFGIEVGPQDLVPANFDSVDKLARYVAAKKNPVANAV